MKKYFLSFGLLLIELNPNDADAHNNRGNTLKKMDNYIEAITDYNKAIELISDNVDTYNKGYVYHKIGSDCPQTLINCNTGIKLDEVYNNMGNAYRHLGKEDKANNCFQKASMIRHNSSFTEI